MPFLKNEEKQNTEEVYKFLTEDASRARKHYERTDRKVIFQASENETKKSVAKQHLKEFGTALLFIGIFFMLWLAFVNIFNL